MPRTMTAEREAEVRNRKHDFLTLSDLRYVFAELDAERAESQRLQSRVEALEGALTEIEKDIDASGVFDQGLNSQKLSAIAHAALHPEPAAVSNPASEVSNPEPKVDNADVAESQS